VSDVKKKSVWKKEMSFGRKTKPDAAERAPVQAPEAPEAPEAQGKPFWKKEMSLKRAPKESNAPREPKQKKEKQLKPKRERPSVRLRMPKRAVRKGARHGGHAAKRLVGLKIGASQLAASSVTNNGSAELLQVAREELEHGIVVGGELREPEKLTEALREFFSKHGLSTRNVRLGIANNRIGVRTFEIAGVDDPSQLDNAIRFRAQEVLPIPIEDAVLDYHILSETTDKSGQSLKRVLLVVAYRELVDRYVSACRNAGINLAGIDLEAFALLRAMGAPSESEAQAALVVVSVGHDRTTFAVSDGRVCEFARVLEWGGNSLNVALARALDVAPSETESLKRALDLGATTPSPGLTPVQLEPAKEVIRRQIESFARELVSSLQFYQNQPGSLSIGEIVLTGGTAHMRGLAEELERLIGVTVRIGDPLMRVRVGKNAVDDEEQQIGSLAIAIGLGIED
jgi:type IV pilus assembly protein PilM